MPNIALDCSAAFFCSGVVAGLVVITPGAGFVNTTGAMIMGVLGGIVPFVAVIYLKRMIGYDDALDTFGVHGVGGMVGALGTGVVYAAYLGGPSEADFDMAHQLLVQLATVATTIVWAAAGTAIAITVARALTRLRVSPEVELEGLDIGEHGERAYNY